MHSKTYPIPRILLWHHINPGVSPLCYYPLPAGSITNTQYHSLSFTSTHLPPNASLQFHTGSR
jgi:hypothetical protein